MKHLISYEDFSLNESVKPLKPLTYCVPKSRKEFKEILDLAKKQMLAIPSLRDDGRDELTWDQAKVIIVFSGNGGFKDYNGLVGPYYKEPESGTKISVNEFKAMLS